MSSPPTILAALPSVLPWLDLATVLTLRRSSWAIQELVGAHLDDRLRELVGKHVPNPSAFINALTFSRGYVVGSVAVAYLLRDDRFKPDGVDVVLPHNHRFTAFLFHILMGQGGRLEYHQNARALAVDHKRGVCAIAHVRTPNGYVYLYQSKSSQALLPITMSSLSVQFSYVNATHFGSAYPSLLVEQRCLLGDLNRISADAVADYNDRNFSLRLYTTHWEDREDEPLCAAKWFECPAQVRTFRDRGSLRIRVHPLESKRLRPRLAWRLDGRPCGGTCFQPNDRIQQWHVMAVVL